MSEVPDGTDPTPPEEATATPGRYQPLRVWPAIVLVVVAVVLKVLPRLMADVPFAIELASVMGPLVCSGLVILWWLLLSRATMLERCVGLLGLGLALAVTISLLDGSMRMPGAMIVTLPMGAAAFALGAILFSRVLSFRRTVVAVLLAAGGFGFSDLLRSEGMWGEFASLELSWRWSASREELLVEQREGDQAEPALAGLTADEAAAWLSNPEWPGFRGSDRTGTQHGPAVATDWSSAPPELVWKIPVGPGWSSFAVAGELLFTQEQRGPLELVVCYQAGSGREVWTHPVETRFDESMGGAGPRATPTLADGMLFAMGANGHLMRLDPRTGESVWQADLQEVADRSPPYWGFSSSPLVVGSNVIVHAGGAGDLGTLAFDAESGGLEWSAPAGDHSYSSPQLGSIAGQELVVVLTNAGADLLEPATGERRLAYGWDYQGYRVLQPHLLGGDSILIATGAGEGSRRVRVTDQDGKLSAEDVWATRQLNPDFNDLVIYQGHGYGFDGAIFTCIDLATGRRKWKRGRYGKGQVLLLADSGLLLVAAEQGEAVLLEADPEGHRELARFQAIDGKTWNHPVVVGDRLFLRNAQEAACYRLPLAGGESLATSGE